MKAQLTHKEAIAEGFINNDPETFELYLADFANGLGDEETLEDAICEANRYAYQKSCEVWVVSSQNQDYVLHIAG